MKPLQELHIWSHDTGRILHALIRYRISNESYDDVQEGERQSGRRNRHVEIIGAAIAKALAAEGAAVVVNYSSSFRG